MRFLAQFCVVLSFLFVVVSYAQADVGFTKEELELVKSACLVGSSFQFATEADGSLSIKNLEGSGKLNIKKNSTDTVDVPDPDKKSEFDAIRTCIRDYLTNKKHENGGAILVDYSFPINLDPKGDNWLALRSQPSGNNGERLKKMNPDTLFTVFEENGDWAHVRLNTGETGWVYKKYIACCKKAPP